MSMISPAINIGIGQFGSLSLDDLTKNFVLRESQYIEYVSFHQLNSVDGKIHMSNFNFSSEEFEKIQLAADGSNQNGENWELKSFISNAYNFLINIDRGLNLNVNFNSIHINLIFAAFEIEHLELLKETILLIDSLKFSGDMGQVSLKCFSILSDENGISTPLQNENIVKTLDVLVEIRKKNNILSHIFILDDKNTQTVSLNINNNYLNFAISEMIVALMRNQYAILENLPSNPIGVFSFGFGMVYFDIHYFIAYFKNKILESKIGTEQIRTRVRDISVSEYNEIVNNTFIPYAEERLDTDSLINNIQKVIDPEYYNHNLGSYEFLLISLLGKHSKISLTKSLEEDEIYSIDDMIYSKLYRYILTDKEKTEEGFLDLKYYKQIVAEYQARIKDGGVLQDDSENQQLKEKIEKHKTAVSEIIQYFSHNSRRKTAKLNDSIGNLAKQIIQAKDDLKEVKDNFNNKGKLIQFFSRTRYEKQKENAENRISDLVKSQEVNLHEEIIKIKAILDQLYAFKSELQKTFDILNNGITGMFFLKSRYHDEIQKLPYLDYAFLHNVISAEKLANYEKTHRTELQTEIKDILKILYSEAENSTDFISKLDEKIERQTRSIIDFKMLNYLLNEYDDMNLLKKFDFVNDLVRLKQRSLPFFNAIPTYNHQSHHLKYFDNRDQQRTGHVQDLLKQNDPSGIPSFIHSESPDKFALLTVEVIYELKSIVKYNNHFQSNNN